MAIMFEYKQRETTLCFDMPWFLLQLLSLVR